MVKLQPFEVAAFDLGHPVVLFEFLKSSGLDTSKMLRKEKIKKDPILFLKWANH